MTDDTNITAPALIGISCCILLILLTVLGGCATGKESVNPGLATIASKTIALRANIDQASQTAKSAQVIVSDVVKTGAVPNDTRVLRLQADVSQLSVLLADTQSKLNDVDAARAVAEEKATKDEAAKKEAEAELEAVVHTSNVAYLVVAILSAIFCIGGAVATTIYTSQITAFIPILGNLASSILALIGGVVAELLFVLLVHSFTGVFGLIVRGLIHLFS